MFYIGREKMQDSHLGISVRNAPLLSFRTCHRTRIVEFAVSIDGRISICTSCTSEYDIGGGARRTPARRLAFVRVFVLGDRDGDTGEYAFPVRLFRKTKEMPR